MALKDLVVLGPKLTVTVKKHPKKMGSYALDVGYTTYSVTATGRRLRKPGRLP